MRGYQGGVGLSLSITPLDLRDFLVLATFWPKIDGLSHLSMARRTQALPDTVCGRYRRAIEGAKLIGLAPAHAGSGRTARQSPAWAPWAPRSTCSALGYEHAGPW